MKVLFVSNFFDNSGYSEAAIQRALALDSVGVDVVVRNLKLNDIVGQVPERILELEQKDDRNCDAVIQYTLPHLMSYNRKAGINIGMFDYETNKFDNTFWDDKLNAMDEIWVPNQSLKQACKNSGVTKPTHIITHACNVEKFQQNLKPLDIPEIADKFVFYTVGEFVRRKNLGAIIKAFHTEFDKDEPVELLIKTSVPGKNKEEAKNILSQFSLDVKKGLKFYNNPASYKQEIIVVERLKEEDLMRLHKSCHCFVSASHGEGWNQPMMDAMGVGNLCIGITEPFLEHTENGWVCNSVSDDAFGVLDSFDDLYMANETWANPTISELRKLMRGIYKGYSTLEAVRESARATPYKYSYSVVGNEMKGRINALCN